MKNPVITIECRDEKGIIAKIATELFHSGLNLVNNQEFVDPISKRFFMRTEIEGGFQADRILQSLRTKLPEGANVQLIKPGPKKIILLVTKESHCLGDLLIRCAHEEINAHIVGVISNHDTLRELVEKFNLPFHHIPHKDLSREEHEAELIKTINAYEADLIVLAKYMRILSAGFTETYKGELINIHHSFLPAFVGAKPYHQAYERGVKIIGATSHFVTAELDQGPIIAQDVMNVEHHHSTKALALAGKDVEKIVLARALSLVLEDRVFINGNKTVIFDG